MSAMPSSASRLNEARNPPRRRRVPIEYWSVPWTQVTKKPNRKACYVNYPAEGFGICNSTPHRFSVPFRQPSRPSHAKYLRVGPASTIQSVRSILAKEFNFFSSVETRHHLRAGIRRFLQRHRLDHGRNTAQHAEAQCVVARCGVARESAFKISAAEDQIYAWHFDRLRPDPDENQLLAGGLRFEATIDVIAGEAHVRRTVRQCARGRMQGSQ